MTLTGCAPHFFTFRTDTFGMAHYKVRKDADTDRWVVQFKDNEPIHHHSFRDAVDSVVELLHLTKVFHTRGRK
jgi:hypothetical protein